MKIKNIIIICTFVLISAIVIFTVFKKNKRTKDPTNDFIDKNNYPFSGFYDSGSQTITEESLQNKLSSIKEVNEHTRDISVKIRENQTITLGGTLKNVSSLCTKVPALNAISLFAPSLEDQQISITLLVDNETSNIANISVQEIRIGKIMLEKNIVSALTGALDLNKMIGTIKSEDITLQDGSVNFKNELPKFLQE